MIARADDDFLVRHDMRKGTMSLIVEEQAEHIYETMGPAVEISGGSAANTIVGVANFGARAAFVGKVRDDALGRVFAHDIRAAGVTFDTPPAQDGPSTARSYILVTPDGERTMNTFLGAAQHLGIDDIHAETIAGAAITYLEGYLWDPQNAKDAFLEAAAIAHDAKRRVALTLSDAFCVDRWRDEFLELIRSGIVDILFANEAELHSLYQTADFATALAALRKQARARRGDPQREGLRRGHAREDRARAGLSGAAAWSTRPAPATCSRRDSCSAWRAGGTTSPRRGSVRSRPPR